jgi:hypothetical protein
MRMMLLLGKHASMKCWNRTNNGFISRHGLVSIRKQYTTPSHHHPSGSGGGSKDSFIALCIGTAAGFMGSLAGMGGGFIMIPLMTSSRLLGLSQHQAHGTSLCAVAATGIAGACGYLEYVEWRDAAALAAGGMLTARWGAQLTSKLSGRALRKSLGLLMLVMTPAVPAKAYFMQQREAVSDKEKEDPRKDSPTVHTQNTPMITDWFLLLTTGTDNMANLLSIAGKLTVRYTVLMPLKHTSMSLCA